MGVVILKNKMLLTAFITYIKMTFWYAIAVCYSMYVSSSSSSSMLVVFCLLNITSRSG